MVAFTVRRYRDDDAMTVMALADRLTIGVASWRDEHAVRAAARGWVGDAVSGDVEAEPVWVAEMGGVVVGFVHGGERRHFSGETDAYVGELAVARHAERQGIGRALLAEVERWAAGRGVRRLTLETGAANRSARAFYAALGFQEEDVRLSRDLSSTRLPLG